MMCEKKNRPRLETDDRFDDRLDKNDKEEFIMNVFLSKFCIMDYDETDEEIKEEARKRSCESSQDCIVIPYLCVANLLMLVCMFGHALTLSTLVFSTTLFGGMTQLLMSFVISVRRRKLAVPEMVVAALMIMLGLALFTARKEGWLIVG